MNEDYKMGDNTMDVTKLWDYRVVRRELEDGETGDWYSVQEVYYDDDGKPMAQTMDLVVEQDTITGMRTQLENMLKALDEPVLDESDIISTSSEGSNIKTEGFEFPTEGKWIYESPDGDETIFRRKFGEDDREEIEKGL